MTETILETRNLTKIFESKPDLIEKIASKITHSNRYYKVYAAQDINISVKKGDVLGLVGESGCGKSTIGKMLAGILKPSGGDYFYKGSNHKALRDDHKKALKIQMIMQDPTASINIRKKIVDVISEAPLFHGLITKAEYRDYAAFYLEKTGLPTDALDRYPHMFSGGQKQRISIARALALKPDFLICDEFVAALDVSIQAQVINLLLDLKNEFDLTMIFISHDLSVIKHISNQICVMYLGQIVEYGETEDVFENPQHPYTQTLLRAIPDIHNFGAAFEPIEGEIPSPLNPPSGCYFHPRCPYVMEQCVTDVPKLQFIKDRKIACHLCTKNIQTHP